MNEYLSPMLSSGREDRKVVMFRTSWSQRDVWVEKSVDNSDIGSRGLAIESRCTADWFQSFDPKMFLSLHLIIDVYMDVHMRPAFKFTIGFSSINHTFVVWQRILPRQSETRV